MKTSTVLFALVVLSLSVAMAQTRAPRWDFVTGVKAGNGTLLGGSGEDYDTPEKCRAAFDKYRDENISRGNWPGLLRVAYCANARTGEKLTLWSENPG